MPSKGVSSSRGFPACLIGTVLLSWNGKGFAEICEVSAAIFM